MMAVVPSRPAVFGLLPFSASSRKTVARSPDSAASTNDAPPGAAIIVAPNETAAAAVAQNANFCILDLRKNAAAVADRLHRNIVPVEDGLQQIGMARILGILQMLPTLDLPVGMTEDRGRQRIVVVTITVAHVAAEQNRGVIQH